MIMCYRGLT